MVALLDEIRKFNRTKAWMSAHTHARIRHGNRARDAGSGLGSPLSPSVLLPSFSEGPGHQASWEVRPGKRGRPRETGSSWIS